MVMACSDILTEQPYDITDNCNKYNCTIPSHENETHAPGLASKALIRKVLKEQVTNIDVNTCEAGGEDAFYVADLGEVYRQHMRWKTNLGRVKPFYGE